MSAQTFLLLGIATLEFVLAGTYILSGSWPLVGMWTCFGLAMLCLAVIA